jgi:hypothetical protein
MTRLLLVLLAMYDYSCYIMLLYIQITDGRLVSVCSLWVKWFGIGFYAPALLRELTCSDYMAQNSGCSSSFCFARGVPKAHPFMTSLSDCCAAFIVSFVVVAVEGIGDITVRSHTIITSAEWGAVLASLVVLMQLFSCAMQTMILSLHF